MMGQSYRGDSLFYTFRLDDYVPKNHLLRVIHEYVDLSFVRERLARYYSHTGRPSIDPEVLLRILLIGYFYGITSERRLVEEIGMHLAYRWFTGLDFNQTIPDHSTFSKNRHKRFKESGIFRDLFDEIVQRCIKEGLVDGRDVSVDGTRIMADASPDSRIPRDQLPEAAKVSKTVRQYLEDLEKENPVDNEKTSDKEDPPDSSAGTSPKKKESETVSTTDPDAAWSVKHRQAQLGYLSNYLMDNKSRVILGVEATPAMFSQEVSAAQHLLEQAFALGLNPKSLGADKAYGNGEFLNWLLQRKIAPHIPVIEHGNHPNNRGFFPKELFEYDKEKDAFRCPNAQWLLRRGISRAGKITSYTASPVHCRVCPFKARCTRAQARKISVHWYEEARNAARALVGTPSYNRSRYYRKQIEGLFGELKNIIRLKRVRLRRLWNVAEQFYLAAAVQNIKRLTKFLIQREATFIMGTA
jgi:transposase